MGVVAEHAGKIGAGGKAAIQRDCACGEGVVDWQRVAKIMAPIDREIFLSVECGKIDEAQPSITFLNQALAKWLA